MKREQKKLHLSTARACSSFIELVVRCHLTMPNLQIRPLTTIFPWAMERTLGLNWMHCLEEESILQCLSPPILFVSCIWMSGWRHLYISTIGVGDEFCICTTHWAQPDEGLFGSICAIK
jgi:hypothetical protein